MCFVLSKTLWKFHRRTRIRCNDHHEPNDSVWNGKVENERSGAPEVTKWKGNAASEINC